MVGKNLCKSLSLTKLVPYSKLQENVQMSFEYLQRRLHHLSGQSVPGHCHPHSKEVLPCVQMERHLFQFVSPAPCSVIGLHRQEPGPICLTPTLLVFISIDNILSQPSLLQAEQPQVSAFPHTGDAPGPSSSLWPSTGLSPEVLYFLK